MRAFLSYGLHDNEMYWTTLLSRQLNQKGFDVITSTFINENSYHGNLNSIFSCNLYIGLLTNPNDIQRILFEFNNSVRKIPSILVVDESLYHNIINRSEFKINVKARDYIVPLYNNNIYKTISLIEQKIDNAKKQMENPNLAWLIGGAALLALLAILSKNK